MGATTNTEAEPILVDPSGAFDGNDGPWSTFNLHAGTPPQPLRLLVSTAVAETWVVSANRTQGGCLSTDSQGCAQSRGGLFNINASSTWQDQGIYGLGAELNLEDYAGAYDNGDYGFDAMGLGLGLPGSAGVRFQSQTIGAIATKDFYLGHLGLTIHRTNFSAFSDPQVTFLESMKASNNIPSLSFAYSAGALYRNKSLASLTLGGYDSAKSAPSQTWFPMNNDISREFLVSLDSITYTDDKHATNLQLSSSGFDILVDSTVPHLWLPKDVCGEFEKAFGIAYNETVDRYLVNDTLHEDLQSRNANVTFLLQGSVKSGQPTVNITLPYASFDLELGPPFLSSTERYFPLRRAANESQYTLGRTFLQESYIVVDYERGNFSISQNTWTGTPPQLVPITAVQNGETDSTTTGRTNASTEKTISKGAIAAIVIVLVLGCLVAVVIAIILIRRKRRRRKDAAAQAEKSLQPEQINNFQKAEMDGSGKPLPGELDSVIPLKLPAEARGSFVAETEGDGIVAEVPGDGANIEMDVDSARAVMQRGLKPVEMDAGTFGIPEAPALNGKRGTNSLRKTQGASEERSSKKE